MEATCCQRLVKHLALITWLLLLSVTALGQTYSNANLNGNYSFNFGSLQNYSWSKAFTCPTQSQITYTVNGSQTRHESDFRRGSVSGLSVTLTSTGKENQTASANTTRARVRLSEQRARCLSGHHEDADRHVFHSVQRHGHDERDRLIGLPKTSY